MISLSQEVVNHIAFKLSKLMAERSRTLPNKA